jgi:sigma-B regulation protein RsbU (phosphoserine phosphatase)
MDDYEARHYPLARVIHDALIPPDLPPVPGVSLALRAHYGERETNVGGDFADVFQVDGLFGLTWGDISGRGREAASLAVMAKYMLRALAFRDPRPASVCYHLNRVLEYTLESEHFLSLVYATYEPGGRELAITNCGGWAPLLFRGGTVQAINVRGPLLGAVAERQYGQVQLMLDPGDILVGFTDGIPEARRGADVMGTGAVETILLEHSDEGETVLSGLIMNAAKRFAGGTLQDDAVVLAMKVQDANGREAKPGGEVEARRPRSAEPR